MNKKGIITKLVSGAYTIYNEDTNSYIIGKPKGVFRIKDLSPKVGDYVDYEDDISVTIINIEKRKTDLVRPCVANIDQALVVFSVKEPELNLNLLDRFLVILEFSNITPVIVFNKWDLLKEEEKNDYQKYFDYYQNVGYECVKTSAKEGLIDQLLPKIDNHLSVITGQSGVGKSSLINVINPSLKLKTAEISLVLNRGKHTTRHTELIRLNNGWLADTPGFGSMEFIDMTKEDIAQNFKEFFNNSSKCKYHGCLHLTEPKCEIKKLVEDGEILSSRYENYKQFLDEVEKTRKW